MEAFFPKATPEQVGISSQDVIDFIEQLESEDVCMHSVLLIRRGKLAAEAYYAPHTADTMHRMFSVTKSFTSLAVGLLESEGKLSLDDPIVDHFPEKLPRTGLHPYIAQITIRDMLMMATAHARTTYIPYIRTGDPDWVKSFFVEEPTHFPGTLFYYDTSASHTLAALVEKLAGMPMLEYLRTKFLDEIGFSKEAYIIPDPMGVSMGGSGLVAKPLDLAKVAWIVMNGGKWQGKQYLPPDYLEAAVSRQIATVSTANDLVEDKPGYGYQFWRVKNNGFGMFGMGGQLAVCFPDEDLLLVTTADTQDYHREGTILDLFFKTVFANLSDCPLPEDSGKQQELDKRLARCAIRPLKGIEPEAGFTGWCLEGGESGEYVFADNPMGLQSLSLSLSSGTEAAVFPGSASAWTEGVLHFTNKTGSHALRFGINRLISGKFPHYGYCCAASGAWASPDTFVIKCHIIDYQLGKVTIRLAFKDGAVTVGMRKVMETGLNEFSGVASGTRDHGTSP